MHHCSMFGFMISSHGLRACRILIILVISFSTAHGCWRKKNCLCLEEFASDLRDPILATHANDNSRRLFIAEQIGVIKIYNEDKTKFEEPFLDIQTQVTVNPNSYDERGFLGLAFHPKHSENGKLYVYYTIGGPNSGKVRLSEFKTYENDRNKVDNNTERVLLEVNEPQTNHNGGQLLFGIDGYLYIFLGDGGGAGDQHGLHGNAQNLTTLLGKALRIDVDKKDEGKEYGIPPDNPFVEYDPTERRHEIFAYGVRNMWRCSVDRGDVITGENRGRIFCGDVGQAKYEEVDIIENGGNYGWRGKEGYACYDEELCYNLENEILPIDVYDHSVGISITGGYVYRGQRSAKLQGKYIFGDWGNGAMFTLTEKSTKWEREDICFASDKVCTNGLVNTYPKYILAFGEDEAGEVYMLSTDRSAAGYPGGKAFRIVDPYYKPPSNGVFSAASDTGTSSESNTPARQNILWTVFGVSVFILLVAVVMKKMNSITKAIIKDNKYEESGTESTPLLKKDSS